MGRPLKVTPLEVLEVIKDSNRTTKGAIAEELDVCEATVSSRLKDLRDNGDAVLFDSDGLYFFDGIQSVNDIEALTKYRDWIIKTLIGTARCSKPIKPLTLEFREKFKELTTRQERVEFKKFFNNMTRLVEYLVIDDEVDE